MQEIHRVHTRRQAVDEHCGPFLLGSVLRGGRAVGKNARAETVALKSAGRDKSRTSSTVAERDRGGSPRAEGELGCSKGQQVGNECLVVGPFASHAQVFGSQNNRNSRAVVRGGAGQFRVVIVAVERSQETGGSFVRVVSITRDVRDLDAGVGAWSRAERKLIMGHGIW
ncbi:hypothetical protein BC828DRAFT_303408 [Blastocladiella britannica]|nr:hypothetical protein BC828DRAFT_303408 [Blastocladiella britannica]